MNTILLSNTNTLPDKLKSICEKCDINIITIEAKDGANENWWNERIHKLFVDNNIERVIIPVSIPEDANNNLGLEIGMHIRLDYLLPIERRCIPIVFLSDLSFTKLMKDHLENSSNPHLLLLTDGVVACDLFELEDVLQKHLDALNPNEYHLFLKQLNVNRRDDVGNHDIANAWGCYRLAQMVGQEGLVFNSPKVREKLGQLYAKLLICLNNAYSKDSKYNNSALISCKGRRILYIDDMADEGWGELLRSIFQEAGNGFVYVDPTEYKSNDTFDFDGFYKKCVSYIGQRWDLVIIDLRLNPCVEDIDGTIIEPDKLSGCKLIKAFLDQDTNTNANEGYQIMVFTASNKIWNVDTALKTGAKEYYIKESPTFSQEMIQGDLLYEKSFVSKVKRCFSNSYLYDMYRNICELDDILPQNNTGDEIYKQLLIAFELLKDASTEEQFAFAYISLYMVIEIINKSNDKGQFLVSYSVEGNVIPIENGKSWNVVSNRVIQGNVNTTNDVLLDYYICRDGEGKVILTNNSIKRQKKVVYKEASEFVKIANYLKANGATDDEIIDVYHRIKARNFFIHGDSRIDRRKDDEFVYPVEREMYTKVGFVHLFEKVRKLCSYLNNND